MKHLYETVEAIFSNATSSIIDGMYDGARYVFDNAFFNSAFTIGLIWIGGLIAFRRINNEETAYKLIWMLLMFSLVKAVIYNQYMYDTFVSLINIPRDAFIGIIKDMVIGVNKNASIDMLINNLSVSILEVANTIQAQAGWNNISAYFYAGIIYLSGAFLILVILLYAVFSVFLSDIVLSIFPFIIPFLIYKKTEYIFFNWMKLYISVSLYAPFTLLFGLITVQVVDMTLFLTHKIQSDFEQNIVNILGLVIAQALTAVAIFKIPNIINQLIGSSNEGGSLTSGVGTVSAGAAIVSTVAKYTGVTFAARQGGKALKRGAGGVADKVGDRLKEKIVMR